MLIKVTSVNKESKGKYFIAQTNYELSGKAYSKNIVSFGDGAEVFKILTSNPTPQHYEVTEDASTKYKNWIKVVPVAAPTTNGGGTGQGAASPSPKSNYETSEERAARQVYIIRQSSIERALELLALNGNKKADVFDVVSLADKFASYVQNGLEEFAIREGGLPTGDVASKLADLENDVPF